MSKLDRIMSKILYENTQQQRNMIRSCINCGTRVVASKCLNRTCPECLHKSEARHARAAARREHIAAEEKAGKEERSQWIVGIRILRSQTGIARHTWYGTYDRYMDVYKDIERVYPDCSNVSQFVDIDTLGVLNCTIHSREHFILDLAALKEEEDQKRAKRWKEPEAITQAREKNREWQRRRIADSRLSYGPKGPLQEVPGQGLLHNVPGSV